jgi:LysM repeat protein
MSYYYQQRNTWKPWLKIGAGVLMAALLVGSLSFFLNGNSGPSKQQTAAWEEALAAHAENNPTKALAALDTYQTFLKQGTLPEEKALEIRVKSYEQLRNTEKLLQAATLFTNSYPNSPFAQDAEALALSAEIQISGFAKPTLIPAVDQFVRNHPGHSQAPRLQLALARHELKIGDMEAGKRRMNALLADTSLEASVGQAVRREVGDLNLAAILNGSAGETTYAVKSGDSIWKIARDHQITSELLLKVNNLTDASKLRVGQSLRIPNTDFSLHCNVSRNELILKNNGEFVKSYTVRTGRVAGTTPTGTYKVLNKKQNPTWRPGDGRVYHPGDPNNELGTRWMAFEGDILGIHGTLHEETLGAYASNGCIGMSREDVEELFDLVLVGTPLIVEGTQDLAFAPVIPAPQIPNPLPKDQIASLQ